MCGLPGGGASQGALALGLWFCVGIRFPSLAGTGLSLPGGFFVFTSQPHNSVHLIATQGPLV